MFHVKHIDNVNFAYYNLIIDIIEIMSYNRLDIEKGGQEKRSNVTGQLKQQSNIILKERKWIMNLIKSLLTQAENGKVLVDIEGNVLSSEKIEIKAKKTYANLIKSGNIDPVETTFNDYVNDVKSEYLTVYDLIDFIRGEEQEQEQEPFEPDAEEIPE